MPILNLVVEKYCEFPRTLRKPMWQVWHKLLIKYDKDVNANFMNYGYHYLNGDQPINLKEIDEKNRYCIQLYDYVVKNAIIEGNDILEVGSGRGGGADYITRYYKPKSYTALDISSSIIKFCNDHYDVPQLKFVQGEAEKLPFEDASFDALVNVESARCYGSIETFFREVHRVLRANGEFLFTDMIPNSEVEDVHKKLEEHGFEIIDKNNISKNVVHALDRDSERREDLINEKIPGLFRKSFSQFAGTIGSERYTSFANGKFQYWCYRLRKV